MASVSFSFIFFISFLVSASWVEILSLSFFIYYLNYFILVSFS